MKKLVLLFLAISIAGWALPVKTHADDRSVTVKPKKSVDPTPVDGKYFAIIIGNNNYKNLPKLKTAVNDAKEVEIVLKTRYGFETKLLIDATRNDILDGLNEMREKVGAKDSLLIYYAGHGEFLKDADKAYWLPVDSRKDRTTNWIIADDITSSIKLIASRHILIVSDSCYSGTLTRAATAEIKSKAERDQFVKKMMERSSRTLMASGGNEPVADEGGGGNHSVFASAFLTALKEADKAVFTAEELFHGRVKEIVAGKSEQVPEYNNIKNSGHEGGDFIFMAKAFAGQTAPSEKDTANDGGQSPPYSFGISEEMKKLQEEKEKLIKERKELEQAKAIMEEKKRLEEERQKLEEEKKALKLASQPPITIKIPDEFMDVVNNKYPAYEKHKSIALAIDSNGHWAYGYSYNYSSQKEANERALSECRQRAPEYKVDGVCKLYAIGNEVVWK